MLFVRKAANFMFTRLKRLHGGRRTPLFAVDGTAVPTFPIVFDDAAAGWVNDICITPGMVLEKKDIYPWGNTVDLQGKESLGRVTALSPGSAGRTGFEKLDLDRALALWCGFIDRAKIPDGWKDAGLYHACFDLSVDRWCAPDWLWTNSALIPHFLRRRQFAAAEALAENLLAHQLPDGGWVVRGGRDDRGFYGIVGPNDAAYLCDHGMLEWFEHSGDGRFLTAAQRCADWIMHRASRDALPYFGWNQRDGKWMVQSNIVDIGFTSGLFCHLYRLLKREEYLDFAERFLNAYTKAFYMGGGRFATALDKNGDRRGTGLFMRGQGWALEGLLPFCELRRRSELTQIAMDTVRNMLRLQRHGGSWLHLWRPYGLQILSGDDSKGTPVIAAALRRSRNIMPKSERAAIDRAVDRAIAWCVRHTAAFGEGAGGVFSWNPEGAFGLNSNVSAACVYSNAYLYELVCEDKQ